MTQVQLQQLQKQLWNIANTLRGKMGADEFRDYILGFIFFKYLSEKAVNFANELLDGEDIGFLELMKITLSMCRISKKLKRMPLKKWAMR
jgi:type I restriction enzyme M protein